MSEYCKNCYELTEQLHRYKQAIEEIKKAVQYDVYTSRTELCIKLNKAKQIIQKCEEVNEHN